VGLQEKKEKEEQKQSTGPPANDCQLKSSLLMRGVLHAKPNICCEDNPSEKKGGWLKGIAKLQRYRRRRTSGVVPTAA
jgi:hypothetical protein